MNEESITNLKQSLGNLEDAVIECEHRLPDIPVEWSSMNPSDMKEIGMMVHLIQRRLGTMKDCMNAIDDIVRYLIEKAKNLNKEE